MLHLFLYWNYYHKGLNTYLRLKVRQVKNESLDFEYVYREIAIPNLILIFFNAERNLSSIDLDQILKENIILTRNVDVF